MASLDRIVAELGYSRVVCPSCGGMPKTNPCPNCEGLGFIWREDGSTLSNSGLLRLIGTHQKGR